MVGNAGAQRASVAAPTRVTHDFHEIWNFGCYDDADICLYWVPSALGIRPYDDGTVRGVKRAPAALRALGLVDALDARDAGDVLPDPYRDYDKPDGRPRNDREVWGWLWGGRRRRSHR